MRGKNVFYLILDAIFLLFARAALFVVEYFFTARIYAILSFKEIFLPSERDFSFFTASESVYTSGDSSENTTLSEANR